MKPPHNISIQFLDVGAYVNVGCKSMAYADLQQMLIDLAAYVNDPKTTIKLMQEQHPGLQEQEPRGLYDQARGDLAGIAAQNLSGYVTNL
jgi:hypothetical protein